jgi:hypothetical protein
MAHFSIGAFELHEAEESTFAEFVEFVKGRSIISCADWGKDRFELGLSGDLMVRFFQTPDGTQINVISTTNPDEIPPLVISLGNMSKKVPISIIEEKLKGLRTLYAFYYLVYSDRSKELISYLIKHPHGDIERALLERDEQLYIESISYGSWIITCWGKTKNAYKALLSVAGLSFVRGREAFLNKLDANVRLLNAKADKEEIAAARESFNLQKDKMDYLLDISDKVDIPEVKELVKWRILSSVNSLTLGDETENEDDE